MSGAFLAHSVAGELHRSEGIARAEAAWSESAYATAATEAASPAVSGSPTSRDNGGTVLASSTPAVVPSEDHAFTLANQLPDQSLWSPSRVAAWQASEPQPVLAILEMPTLDLEVPVFRGDMERGPAWIAGTALPGEAGNAGISGHRDGYFRALKDAAVGDSLHLRTATGQQRYVVDDIRIVDPLDVEVLDPTDEHTVTLVTCYPFYFVGSAPQRYIVRARLDDFTATAYSGEL